MKSKTKLFLVIGLVVLGIAGYGYLKAIPGVGDQTENQPRIEISPQSFDFGDIQYGQVVEYTFKLKNTGQALLEIKRVSTSCGCTSAEVSKEEIGPGEEIDLLVTYNTGAMSGDHAKGEQERIIYVKSSDPVNPQAEVMIYANVQ